MLRYLFLCWTLAAPLAAKVEEGKTGNALYAIHFPDNWNRKLVLFAHGYVRPVMPIALPNIDAAGGTQKALKALVARGYAVAFSSYSQNGFAVEQAAAETEQLRKKFVESHGQPERTYLLGQSLGGIIVLKILNDYGAAYDGALHTCSFDDSTAITNDHIHVRVIHDYYCDFLKFPIDRVPEDFSFDRDLAPHLKECYHDPKRGGMIKRVRNVPDEGSFTSKMRQSVEELRDLMHRNGGYNYFDNSTYIYQGSPDDVALNLGVKRLRMTPQGREYMRKNYTQSGPLNKNVLSMHTTGDYMVPIRMQLLFKLHTDESRSGGRLAVQQVRRDGHCAFNQQEILGGMADLEQWRDTGRRPASGDVTKP